MREMGTGCAGSPRKEGSVKASGEGEVWTRTGVFSRRRWEGPQYVEPSQSHSGLAFQTCHRRRPSQDARRDLCTHTRGHLSASQN